MSPAMATLQMKPGVQKRLAADAEAKRAKIKDLVAQGKSLERSKLRWKAIRRRRRDAADAESPGFASFTEVVYKELTKKSA